jgi:putative transposase
MGVRMSQYRRTFVGGGCYFFTVVTYARRPILCDAEVRAALRAAIEEVRIKRPFTINAWVLLPDHLHCIWTLPEDDEDFSTRWMMIKRKVSITCRDNYHHAELLNKSKQKHRESTLWQRRFWEHKIRNEEDFISHMNYVHFNPVKHSLVETPAEWPHSTYHRYT